MSNKGGNVINRGNRETCVIAVTWVTKVTSVTWVTKMTRVNEVTEITWVTTVTGNMSIKGNRVTRQHG